MVLQQASATMAKPDEALRERVLREKARRHLMEFNTYVSPWYRPYRHNRLICEYLELVETYIRTRGATGIGRLLVLLPPRHSKSETVSRHYPAWVLGRMPDTRIILASYGADLAESHSRAAREILSSERYQAVFGALAAVDAPVELSSDSRSVAAWDLAAPHRGGLTAAGVGGGITGKGANLFIMDDPFKNRDEAESEPHRQRVWDWWTSSAYTRLEDGGAVIGMLTRWHGDDWAGRLLRAMAQDAQADRWVVLNLPAIWERPAQADLVEAEWDEFRAQQLRNGVWVDRSDLLDREPGQALWPEKYNEDDLSRIRANIGQYDWQALYQQSPYARDGAFFKREWFPVVDEGPAEEEIAGRVRYWDKAASRSGDYTAGVLMCRTRRGTYYVEHVAHGQWTPGQRDEVMMETAIFDASRKGALAQIWHQQDPASAGRDSAEATNRMLAGAGYEAHFEPVSGSKEVRAGPWSSMCEGGGVRLVRGGWNQAFIEEHAAFPKGKYDDQVDAASSAFTKLSKGILEGQLFF